MGWPDARDQAAALSDVLRRRASHWSATVRIESRDAGGCGADRGGDGLRHRRSEPGLPGEARGGIERRVGPAARSAEDRRDFSRHPQSSDDSLHREVPHGLEREPDCVRGAGAHGRGRRVERAGAACAHARAGLQRPGAVELDCRGESSGAAAGDRQWRRAHAGGCGGDGGRDGLRRGDDRARGAGESVDLPADCAVHGDGQLRPADDSKIATA